MRYYAHYTVIYPDVLLTDFIIETDSEGRITAEYPFEREVANTVFHSGLQLFVPEDMIASFNLSNFLEQHPSFASLSDMQDILIRSFRV